MRLIEPPGNDQLQYHDEFAAITASEFGAAMSGNPVDFAMLRSRGNLEADGVTFEELNLQGGPERCLRKGDWGDGHEVVLVTLELFMFLDRDDDMEVSTQAASVRLVFGTRRLTFPLDSNHLAVSDAGRDFDLEISFDGDASGATAIIAMLGDDLASASAIRTSHDHAEHPTQPSLFDLAHAFTGGTLDRSGARLRTAALALDADIEPSKFNVSGSALKNIFQRDLDLCFKVEASGGAASASTRSSLASAENVVEHREDVIDIHSIEVMSGRAAETFMAELIVLAATIRVRQNLVRLGAFLEGLLGFFVSRITVRVELHREAAIRPFDLIARRGAFNREDFVVAAGDAHPAWIPTTGSSRMRGESALVPDSPRVDREQVFS